MDSKQLNYKKEIIKALAFGEVLSSIEISEKIQKSLPLVNRLLTELVHEGMLEEKGYAVSTGGRRPLIYSIQKNRMFVISIAMDQFVTKLGLIDIHSFQLTHQEQYELPLLDNEESLSQLIDIIRKYYNSHSLDKNKILGIGMGMPGFVDIEKGINHTFLPTANGQSLREILQEAVELPVFIDNDSSLIALTELTLGQARNSKHALVINFGWGVGLGMIVNGKLFRGHNGFAGEFSHIPVFTNNKLCSCGKSGCLETGASMLVILEKAKAALASGRVSALHSLPDEAEAASELILSAAVAGDQLAIELISDTAYDIGRCIAILIHILNPEKIIISGRGAVAGPILLAPIYQAINRYCIPRLASYTTLSISDFNIHSELLGAAALVLENFDQEHLLPILKENVT